MSSFLQAIENITPEIHQSLKLALEIGKWPDGRKLTLEQKELTLQALIAWEIRHLPEDQRIGYMGEQACGSKSKPASSAETEPNPQFKALH